MGAHTLGAGLVAMFVCLYVFNSILDMEVSRNTVWVCGALFLVVCLFF